MKKNDLLIILIPTLLCVFAWIGFNVYHSAVTPTISEPEMQQVSPINPTFDTKTISQLKNRNFIVPNFQNSSVSTTNLTPTPTIQAGLKKIQATTGGELKQ